MVHREDIYSRPKKEWIVSTYQKTKLKEQAKEVIEGQASANAAQTTKYGKDSKFTKKETKGIDKSTKSYKKTDQKPLSKQSKKIVRNKNRTVNKKGQKKSNVNYKKRN